MNERLTIGRLAQEVGLPTTTLRYYERTGLLQPEDRSQGNYRLYSEESLRRLKFIKAATEIGFTLNDTKALLNAPNDGGSCRDVQALIERRLADIERTLEAMQFVKGRLRALLRDCRKAERGGQCAVVEKLNAAAKRRT